MGPRKLPPAALVGKAGGGLYCRYCRCYVKSAGFTQLGFVIWQIVKYLLYAFVSAAAFMANPHDEVSSQVLAIPKVWQSRFLQGASGERCDRGPCAGPAGCPRRRGTLDS